MSIYGIIDNYIDPMNENNRRIKDHIELITKERDSLKAQVDELKQILDNREVTSTDFFEQLKTSRKLKFENDSLKAQIDELSGHSLAQADEIKQLKIYLTNYQNDMIEKNRQLEIAVKALKYYDGVHRLNWTIDFADLPKTAKEALEQIQKMRGG